MNRSAALVALTLAACDGGPMPVFLVDARTEGRSFDRVAEACAFWGIACEPAHRTFGSLTVFMTEAGAHTSSGKSICGQLFDDDPCSPAIYSCARPQALEHEIGHVFLGREHSADPDNVMFAIVTADPFDATDEQITRVRLGADHLAACR